VTPCRIGAQRDPSAPPPVAVAGFLLRGSSIASPESDRECAAGAEDVRDYRFWANDHLVQVQVGIGAAAGPDLIAQLEQAVSSFDA